MRILEANNALHPELDGIMQKSVTTTWVSINNYREEKGRKRQEMVFEKGTAKGSHYGKFKGEIFRKSSPLSGIYGLVGRKTHDGYRKPDCHAYTGCETNQNRIGKLFE